MIIYQYNGWKDQDVLATLRRFKQNEWCRRRNQSSKEMEIFFLLYAYRSKSILGVHFTWKKMLSMQLNVSFITDNLGATMSKAYILYRKILDKFLNK